jgi:ABC-2 type transport system ATP-binding protein
VIELDGIVKTYGTTTALAGLDLLVGRGEVVGLLGPNGAGKTTTIKLLLGMARPTAGTGRVLGAALGDRAARARIGYLPELFRYQPWLHAREVLALHARLGRIAAADRRRAVDEALDRVGLTDRADDAVSGFSKGMQQRLGLGVALLGEPELVLLDEPTSALDPLGRTDVRAVVRSARDRGATVILNSHLLTEVERVCDRVVILHHGRSIAAGPLDQVVAIDGVRLRVTGLADAPAGRSRPPSARDRRRGVAGGQAAGRRADPGPVAAWSLAADGSTRSNPDEGSLEALPRAAGGPGGTP